MGKIFTLLFIFTVSGVLAQDFLFSSDERVEIIEDDCIFLFNLSKFRYPWNCRHPQRISYQLLNLKVEEHQDLEKIVTSLLSQL